MFVPHNLLKEKAIIFTIFFKEKNLLFMHLEAEESGIAVWWCHVEGLGFEVALCVCFPQSSERESNLLRSFLQGNRIFFTCVYGNRRIRNCSWWCHPVESRAILSRMPRKQGAIVATVGNCREKKWQRCVKRTTTDSFNCCECAYYREESNCVVVFEKRMFLVWWGSCIYG